MQERFSASSLGRDGNMALPNIDLPERPSGPMFGDIPGWMAAWAHWKPPAYLEAMELANNLRSWLRRYLFRFPGTKQANLQSYLNWFVCLFRAKRDEEDRPMNKICFLPCNSNGIRQASSRV